VRAEPPAAEVTAPTAPKQSAAAPAAKEPAAAAAAAAATASTAPVAAAAAAAPAAGGEAKKSRLCDTISSSKAPEERLALLLPLVLKQAAQAAAASCPDRMAVEAGASRELPHCIDRWVLRIGCLCYVYGLACFFPSINIHLCAAVNEIVHCVTKEACKPDVLALLYDPPKVLPRCPCPSSLKFGYLMHAFMVVAVSVCVR
jgi:hypothetical protein